MNGGPSAATDLLRDAAAARLADRLAPLVSEQMQRLDLYAACGELERRASGSLAASPSLVRHVAHATVDGVLVLIAREERRMRQDPAARSGPAVRALLARTDAADAR